VIRCKDPTCRHKMWKNGIARRPSKRTGEVKRYQLYTCPECGSGRAIAIDSQK